MLNVDQHNPSLKDKNRMTKEQFIRNNRGIDKDKTDDTEHDVDKAVLEKIFHSIGTRELMTNFGRENVQGNLFHEAPMQGWLKKQGGEFTLSWKRRYFILSGDSLYYFRGKDDVDPLGFFPLEGLTVELKTHGSSSAAKPSTLFQLLPITGNANSADGRASAPVVGGAGGGGFVKSVRNDKRSGFSRGSTRSWFSKQTPARTRSSGSTKSTRP